MYYDQIIDWLLAGDVSVRYQVYRNLLYEERKDLQDEISREGRGAEFFSKRNPNGPWGSDFYHPEWKNHMQPPIDVLLHKGNKNGTCKVQATHTGHIHFNMEKAVRPSRWKTLRALRVLKYRAVNGRPQVVIVFGLPGSGKSYFAERLAEKIDAEYVSSDRLRRVLFPSRTYSDHEKSAVYEAMLKKMMEVNAEKKNVVLDGTFHRKETRQLFIKNTKEKIRFIEVWADRHIIKERLKKSRPYSEADYKIHQQVQQEWEPLKEDHLRLQSTNDNIDDMLQKALYYLNDDKRSDR